MLQVGSAETVAAFLSIRQAEVLKLTRECKIRGYAYKGPTTTCLSLSSQRSGRRFCLIRVSAKGYNRRSSPWEPEEKIQWLTK